MVTSSKTVLRGEALKANVLNTALKLFSERGYFNTSIHDIRRAAGVSIGAIYHHFRNKEALAKSLYEDLLQQMDQAIEAACFDKRGCLEKSRAIIEKMFSLTLEQPRHMQFVLLAQHREYLPDEAPICSSKPFQTMKTVVLEGIEAGEVRDLEPWVAATAMFGGALRMMNLQLDGALERPLTEYFDEVVDCAWRGVKA
ncbi:MAG: TetR/AcrR family transcriptional regulator [Candidatus Thiodiazotropha sp. (ex Codakia rugifera)]|nr:TetR/AcrR family transcriptional regulator [Candidatus Thiodiazotropha sp. (ex Codakia rugifera)]